MMKRILSLLLVLSLLFGLTACSIDQETIDLAADVAISLLEEAADTEEAPVSPQETPEIEPIEEPSPEEIPEEPTEEAPPAAEIPAEEEPEEAAIDEYGWYTTKDDVALYLYTYGRLPDNFMTKKDARALGWEGGGLDPFAKDMCIGGDRFGNYEGILPDAPGRSWTECDIDTMGASSRGAKRIVFSNDGLIYYTDDHYESFTLLYGED